jgi:hypothetical protein
MTLILSGTDGLSDIDGSASTPAIRGTDANTGIFFPAADTIAFSEGGVESMRIDSSGNVGIGMSSPTTGVRLDVFGGYARLRSNTTINADISGNINALVFESSGGTGEHAIIAGGNTSNNILTFYTAAAAAPAERARIDSSGNLLVGKTTTAETTAGSCFSTTVNNIGLSSGNYFIVNYVPGGASTMIDFRTGGVSKGSISQNGSVMTYGGTSDYRLKENIEPMIGGLEKVATLKPCTYVWKETGQSGQGFIAHELQTVIPDAVVGEKDAVNEDGSIKPQFIDASHVVATLTAAIQEQQQMIETLQAKVAALEAKG